MDIQEVIPKRRRGRPTNAERAARAASTEATVVIPKKRSPELEPLTENSSGYEIWKRAQLLSGKPVIDFSNRKR